MGSLSYTAAALTQLRKLSPAVRERITERLMRYATTKHGDVKKLKGRPGARLRVGEWRVIFVEENDAILILALGHRRDIYD